MKQTSQNLHSFDCCTALSLLQKRGVLKKMKYLLLNDFLFNLQNIITFMGY